MEYEGDHTIEELDDDDDDPEKQALEDASKGLLSRKLSRQFFDQLLNICAALGGFETVIEQVASEDGTISSQSKRKYVLGDEALGMDIQLIKWVGERHANLRNEIDCLRDLKKYLKFDHNSLERAISIRLGEWQILQTVLFPMFLSDEADERIRSAIRELHNRLTMSMIVYLHPSSSSSQT